MRPVRSLAICRNDDLSYFVTHPCHPPIFNDEATGAGRKDHFGGIAAKQGIVNALMQGPEAYYALGEQVGRAIDAPVVRSRRVRIEQMTLLEPGLSETVVASLLSVMKDDWKRVFEPEEISACIQRTT